MNIVYIDGIKDELDKYNYTFYLINYYHNNSMVDKSFINKFSSQLSLIIKDTIKTKYGEMSEAVKIEDAERISMSIIFSLDTFLYSLTTNQAIGILETRELSDIYGMAKDYLKGILEKCRLIFENIKVTRTGVDMLCYLDTIDDACNEFFFIYDIDFNAHEAMIAIDYPLVFDDMKHVGLKYMHNYLINLEIEQNFINIFDETEVNNLIRECSIVYGIEAKYMVISIFELVINNTLFLGLLGKSPMGLILSDGEYNQLVEYLNRCSMDKIRHDIDLATCGLIEHQNIVSDNLIEYLQAYVLKLYKRIKSVKMTGDYRYLAIKTSKHKSKHSRFIDNTSMSDREFKNLYEAICDEHDSDKRIDKIIHGIKSLADYFDILSSDVLIEDEYTKLFNRLDINTKSLLMMGILTNSSNDGADFAISKIDYNIFEKEWMKILYFDITNLSAKDMEYVEKAIIASQY